MREYVLVGLIATAVTYLLCGPIRLLAQRSGAVAKVRDRDVHTRPVAYFGGVAMLVGVSAAFFMASRLPFLGRNQLIENDIAAVLLAGAVICAVGVLDDLYELNAIAKLAGQVLAAGLVVVGGVQMLWIPLPNTIISLDPSASIAITVFFIVLCTNAVNYVDGLDGLATGVVGIGAAAFFGYCYLTVVEQGLSRATTASLITVAIVGVCAGFLPHNFHPARMFMGDSGAMLLGLLLATSSISLTGQFDSAPLQESGQGLLPAYLPLVLPLAVTALPIADFLLAFLRRTYQGKWFWVADKQHLHHRLLDRGHSHRRAVLLMYVWSGLISFGVAVIGWTQAWWLIAIFAVLIAVVTFITVRGNRSARSPGTAASTGPRELAGSRPRRRPK